MTARYKNIARVLKAHGSKGEVVAASLRGLPFLLRAGMQVALTPPALDRPRFVRVASVNRSGDTALVSFDGMRTLDQAEAVVGCTVLAHAEDLDLGPLDAAADELLGRALVDARYGELGRVTEVMCGPANDVWAVEGPYGEVLVPVIESVVPAIPESGPIAVTLMDGLINP